MRVLLRVCFLGGWIDEGESQAEAVVREMREELNAEVVPSRCVWRHIFGEPPRVLWGWLAELTSPSLTPNPAEVHAILWLTVDEAVHHPDVLPFTTPSWQRCSAHQARTRGPIDQRSRAAWFCPAL